MKVLAMSYLKLILISIFSLISCFYLYHMYKNKRIKNAGIVTIAIFKTASHHSLDEAETGFLDEIKRIYPENRINLLFYNAEGSMIQAHAIAQEIVADKKITAFYTIGSLATQALSFVEQNRPIIFSAVSHPETFLSHNKEKPKHICGISDSLPPERIVNFIKQKVPFAKKIGILRSSQAFNEIECSEITKELQKNNIEIEHFIINQENEIDSLLMSFKVSQVDAIFSPSDNIVASCIKRIASILEKQKKPFLASFYDKNISISIGLSYKKIGIKIAQQLKKILFKEKLPFEINFSSPSEEDMQ